MRVSSTAVSAEFGQLRELTARIGSDRTLTQASTGNSSAKFGGELWIKRSGCWMSAAMRDDIFIHLNLDEVGACLRRNIDPSEFFAGASLETAMHAVLPHRIVVHVHSVNGIAWAVRPDGLSQIQARLGDLRWQWIPYLPSGLPLAMGIERAWKRRPDTALFVLANHGLVIGGEDVPSVHALLSDVHRRLDISPRVARSADHATLARLASDSVWRLPDVEEGDEEIHSLATDPVSRRIVSRGILYPCQAIFSGAESLETFRAIDKEGARRYRDSQRPFLFVNESGVLVNRSAGAAAVAMLAGLAQVAKRLGTGAPIRYLTDAEVSMLSPEVANRYRKLASAGSVHAGCSPAHMIT
ncbi:MAG TPA: class II aldolase/adducin family protein [Bryobacteraceae bacterium]|jgi:rhamnose utilization protein RhaD (predicted bifunctional aldolase and dehydrogenase)|nr:class II aldolase/adducin family protein [Bryobacteraceae bacterium]